MKMGRKEKELNQFDILVRLSQFLQSSYLPFIRNIFYAYLEDNIAES